MRYEIKIGYSWVSYLGEKLDTLARFLGGELYNEEDFGDGTTQAVYSFPTEWGRDSYKELIKGIPKVWVVSK